MHPAMTGIFLDPSGLFYVLVIQNHFSTLLSGFLKIESSRGAFLLIETSQVSLWSTAATAFKSYAFYSLKHHQIVIAKL
jgi:hypothetical protein